MAGLSLSSGMTLGLGPRSNLPPLPAGFAFLVTDAGDYILTDDGNYIIVEVA